MARASWPTVMEFLMDVETSQVLTAGEGRSSSNNSSSSLSITRGKQRPADKFSRNLYASHDSWPHAE